LIPREAKAVKVIRVGFCYVPDLPHFRMPRMDDNIYADIAAVAGNETFLNLLQTSALRIERIISTGQATPSGEWLDQDRAEWVMVLRGSAALRFEGEDAPCVMQPGNFVSIPAHTKHRVEWTAKDEPTIWLAIHYAA
jgi:cupin 2 domain-containing protein